MPPWTGDEITEEQAEQAVETSLGKAKFNVKKGMTHQAIVKLDGIHKLVWVVYTDNPLGVLDVAYFAHYVDERGEVIGSVPTVTPYSADVENNSLTELAFMGMEPDAWSGDVTLYDGITRSPTVPIMKDEEGNQYLGDLQRKILCVDYLAWEKDEELQIRQSRDGRFDDGKLLTWCLKQMKMDDYMDVLEQAIEETGISDIFPTRIPEGCAMVTAEIPGDPPCVSGDMSMKFVGRDENGDETEDKTWPDERLLKAFLILPAGNGEAGNET